MVEKDAILVLEDGTIFRGKSFGYEDTVSGEVVFNTAMTGYPESLTDPSYRGQILVTTYPILGNYGVPSVTEHPERFESDRIHPCAIVCQDYSHVPSHWQSVWSLGDWLKEQKVIGVYDIDTRALTRHLRDKGSMLGRIEIAGLNNNFKEQQTFDDPNSRNLIEEVSIGEVIEYGQGDKHIVLIDCGTKNNIIRHLVSRGIKVSLVPWNYNFMSMKFDGLFISNGPGSPMFADQTVENVRQALNKQIPTCGICMGNQILARAAGANIYKLKYGHRGHNQPVQMIGTQRCYITSQNHGFAVDSNTLPSDWEELFVNLNDGSNEGIKHKTLPFFSAQFHPEASSGPTDTEFVFDEFIKMLTVSR